MGGHFTTKTYLALTLGVLFVVLSVVVVVLANSTMKQLALHDAEHAARMLLDHNLAVHTYFTKDLKPKLFEQLGPTSSKDYFEPAWMSSTYAVRQMDKYFQHFSESRYYYRESAVNARSPENEADTYENTFLADLQKDPQLTTKSAIRVLDGKPYFTVLRRGEAMEESCLRCHSEPEKAPGDMVRQYGPERSFHRKLDEVVQAISIRIPLSEAFSSATRFSYLLSSLLLAALGGGFLFVWVGNKRLIIDPMSRIREHAVRIATRPEFLGETIQEPKAKELSDLVAAFNQMSVALKKSYDELEQRVAERTYELARERERLQITLRSIGDGVISTDTEGRVTALNREAEDLTGWKEKEALWRPLEEVFVIVSQETRESCENPVEKVLKTGQIVGLANNTVLIARDGTERILADSGAPIQDEDGKVLGVVLVFRDVTDRVRSEQALKKSQELQRSIVASSPLAVFSIDPNGIVLTWNPSAERILGWAEEEVIGHPLPIVPPDKSEEFAGLRQRVMSGQEFSGKEVVRQKKDGAVFHASLSAAPIHDSHGNIVAIMSTIEDVTQRKEAEEKLDKERARLKSILDNMPDGVYIANDRHQIEYLNPKLESTFGPISNRLCYQYFHDRTDPCPWCEHFRAFDGKSAQREWYSEKVGRTYELFTTPLINDDGSISKLEFFHDITERKKAEVALRDSEVFLHSTLDALTAHICILDEEGAIVQVNESWRRFGQNNGIRLPNDCIGTNYFEICDSATGDWSEDAAMMAQMIRELIEGSRDEFYWEYPCHSPSEKRWFSIHATRFMIAGETRVVLTHENITDRKLAEEKLIESEERYRTIADFNYDWEYWVNAEDRLLYVSPSCERITGYTAQEFLDDPGLLERIVHPDDRTEATDHHHLARRIDYEKSYTLDFRIIRRDGSVRWIGHACRPVYGQAGQPLGRRASNRDITERKKAEEALRQMATNLAEAQRVAKIGNWEFDIASNRVNWSDELHRIFEISESDFDGRHESFVKLVHPDDQQRVLQTNLEARTNGSPFELDYRIFSPEGQVKTIREVGYADRDDNGRTIRIFGTAQDITEPKKAEESLRQSEQRYRTLFDNMSDAVSVYKAVGDGEDFVFADFNKSGEKLERRTKEELLGKSVQEAFPGVREFGLFEAFQRVWRTGVPERHPVSFYRDERIEGWRENYVYRLPSGEIVTVYNDQTERERAKQTLESEKRKFQALAESSPYGLVMIRQDGSYVYANPQFREMFGYDLSETPTGKDWLRKVFPDPDYRHEVIAAWFEDSEPDTPDRVRPRIFKTRCKDGTQKIIHFRPVLLPSGDHVVTYEDITSRQKADEAIRESEEKYRNIFENAVEGIFQSTQEGRLISVNPAYAGMFGYGSPEEMLREVTDAASQIYANAADREAVKQRLIEAGLVKNYELRCRRRDGSRFWVSINARSVRDESGRLLYYEGTTEDVTARKDAEKARLESEARYGILFNDSKDGVYVTSRDGKVLEANQAYLDILGYSRGEMVGGDVCVTYANPADRDRFVRAIESSGFLKDYALPFRRKDGKQIECLITASVRKTEDGSILGYHGIMRDVTEQKNLQRQLLQAQKMEAIGTLAGGIAHDFNNVLQVALGYSEFLLGDKSLPKQCRADLRKVHDSAKRGADLVQRLLTFSRKTEINPRPLNLNRRITELRKMLERTVPKMIDIQLVLDEGLSTINADPTQIDQILMNLAVNARDAMPDGGKLIIETENVLLDEEYTKKHLETKQGVHVLLTVTDTGVGMDKETLEHIFEPFYTTKGVGEGTGLGLAMVHGIVKHHGGHVKCYSEPGQGTTFKMYFPALLSEEEHEDSAAKIMPMGGSETILLVDDEEFLRDLGSRILTKAGYKVITASNGKEALEVYKMRRDEIGLVVLDLIMPEMGGRQCLEGLLSLDPSVRVVIASGYSADAMSKEALVSAAKGFVSKPYDIGRMLGVVREALE